MRVCDCVRVYVRVWISLCFVVVVVVFVCFRGFVFLSFDGSKTLIEINIIGFPQHPTNGVFPRYSGFLIHPLGRNSFFYRGGGGGGVRLMFTCVLGR